MGDIMILNNHEVKTCLVYALTPIFKKYCIEIREALLMIHDMVEVHASIAYQDRVFDLHASFTISYKNNQLCFENITGKVEYLFLQLNVMSVLQQLIHDEQVTFQNNACYYLCDLPICELTVEDEHLYISLKE